MNQGNQKISARQEQPAKTSVVNCGTQPHSVVASEPKTGMSNLYTDEEMARYSWLRRDRPSWLFALRHNLCPERMADEHKSRLLFTQIKASSGCILKVKEFSTRFIPVEDEHIFSPCGSRCDDSLPTMAWLEEPYHKVHRDTCKRKRGKRDGTNHLKERMNRALPIYGGGRGVRGGRVQQRLHGIYRKLRGTPSPPPKKVRITPPCSDKPTQATSVPSGGPAQAPMQPIKGCVEQMRMPPEPPGEEGEHDDEHEDPFAHYMNELRVLYGDWDTLPLVRKLILLTIIFRIKRGQYVGTDRRTQMNDARDAVYVTVTDYCRSLGRDDMNGAHAANMILRAQMEQWLRVMLVTSQDWDLLGSLFTATAPFDLLGDVFSTVSKETWWRQIPIGIKYQIPPHAPENYYGDYLFSIIRGRNGHHRGWLDIVDGLFWAVQPRGFEVEPWMEEFAPSGAAPHWESGGRELLIARAVLWAIMSHNQGIVPGTVPTSADLTRAVQIMEGSPGITISFLVLAMASGLEHAVTQHMGPGFTFREALRGMSPDFYPKWFSDTIMGRPDEYSTLLESILRQKVPYWDRIEPFLRAMFAGWLASRALGGRSRTERVAAMIAACTSVYMEHALTSRTFSCLCQSFKDMVQKYIGKLIELLESIWSRMNREAREQSYTSELFDWMSRVFAVTDGAMFSKIMETVAVIGAIFTCPWSGLNEEGIIAYANKVLTSLSQTTFKSLQKLTFIEKLWELAKFFFVRAKLAWQAGDALLFLYGRDEFVDLVDKVNVLVSISSNLSTLTDSRAQCIVEGIPYNLDTYRSMMADVGKIIAQINKDVEKGVIRELPSFVGVAMTRYAKCVRELSDFDTTQRNRPLPFVIFMVGAPAAGKNSIMDDIIRLVFEQVDFLTATYTVDGQGPAKFAGFEKQKLKPVVYTKNAFDPYDSGYCNRHNAISFIEMGCFASGNPEGVKQSFNQVASFFNYVDTAPYSPVMADVDSKGKMSASSIQLAAITANNMDLHKEVLREQMAFARRLGHAIEATVKPAFRDHATSGLNKDSIRPTEFKMDDDMWIFTIHKPVAKTVWSPNSPSTEVEWVVDESIGTGGKFYTNRDFIEWLIGRVEKHVEEQARIMLQGTKASSAPTCRLCRRWNHVKEDHCGVCGGMSHVSENPGGDCMRHLIKKSQSLNDCGFCSGDSPGCSACDEGRWAKRAMEFAIEYFHRYKDPDNKDSLVASCELPCFCSRCYRPMLAHLGNHVTCYSCKNVDHHTYLKVFMQTLKDCSATSEDLEARDMFGQLDPDFVGMIDVSSIPGLDLICTTRGAYMYQRGVEQMLSKETVAIAACAAVTGLAVGLCCRPRISVSVAGEAGELLRSANSAVRLVKKKWESFADQAKRWKKLEVFSELEWFQWARSNALGLVASLKAFTATTWIKIVGLAAALMAVYKLFSATTCTIVNTASDYGLSVSVGDRNGKHVRFNITYKHPVEAINMGRGEEHMRLFDAKYVATLLEQYGMTTGARPSYPSAQKVDNPWLSYPSLGVRENIGKRSADLGARQGEIAMTRIEKSIYMLCSAVCLDDGQGLQNVRLEDGSRQHCILLTGNVFVANTHFLVHAVCAQVHATIANAANIKQSLTTLVPEAEAIANSLDWDDCVRLARDHGVRGVWMGVSGKFSSDECPGVTTQQWQFVDFINIAGNIHTDISLIRFNRFAAPQGAGIVRGKTQDLGNSLLIPREHTAATDALFVDKSMSDVAVNRAVSVFIPNVQFELKCCGKERTRTTDVWSFPVSVETTAGDCGLPLIGVWHTKYSVVVDDDGKERKVIDPDGDAVFILGLHRIYQPAYRMMHAAPINIDIVSMLWGKLDEQAKPVQQDKPWKLFSLPEFGAGLIPTRVPKVNFAKPLNEPFDLAQLSATEYTDVVFKRGSRNQFHDKSPMQWMGVGKTLSYAPDMGEALALHGVGVGSTAGFRQGMFKSGVSRLPIANWFGFEQRHVAPKLNDRYGKEINLVALSGATDGPLDYRLLRIVANDMVLETIDMLDMKAPQWRDSVHPLTDVETIAGSSVANFTPGINRATGMGFPIYGSKDPHITIERDKTGAVLSVCMRDEVLDEIGRNIDAYMRGQRANPVFTATPKDERLGANKILPIYDVNGIHLGDAHNLRIFLCGSYPFIHLQRQQYLSIIRLVCEYPEVFEMAVGTNVASPRWGLMGKWLTWDGLANSTILAGDYSKYDKRMTATWVRIAFEVLISIMVNSRNYSEADIIIASGIACDTATPLIDWFGDWSILTNGHPSGHALTTIINGIVNRLYLRYAYYILCVKYMGSLVPYRDVVRTYVYGDDNVSGVIGCAVKFFTMPNISRELLRVGVILTTEDKIAIVEDFTTIDKAAFLKRKWVMIDGMVVAPLAMKSLQAMVTVGVINHAQVTTQMFQILRSYCDEYFHYGADAHARARDFVIALCNDEQYWADEGYPLVGHTLRAQWLKMGDDMFPTFTQLVDRWSQAAYVPMY